MRKRVAGAEREQRRFAEPTGMSVRGEHRLDLARQPRIVTAPRHHEGRAVGLVAEQARVEDLSDLPPALRRHSPRLPVRRAYNARPRRLPLPLDGGNRQTQHVPGLFERQSAKEPQFSDLTLARIERGQMAQRRLPLAPQAGGAPVQFPRTRAASTGHAPGGPLHSTRATAWSHPERPNCGL